MATTLFFDLRAREACTDAVLACYRGCRDVSVQFQSMSDAMILRRYLRMLGDCAGACQATATLLMRESEHEAVACHACGEIAASCGRRCRSIGHESMQACADACELAAEACLAYADQCNPRSASIY